MFLWAEELNDTPRTTQGATDKTFLLLPKQGIIYSTLQGSADDFSISIFLLGFLKHTETSALSNSSFPLFFSFFFSKGARGYNLLPPLSSGSTPEIHISRKLLQNGHRGWLERKWQTKSDEVETCDSVLLIASKCLANSYFIPRKEQPTTKINMSPPPNDLILYNCRFQ